MFKLNFSTPDKKYVSDAELEEVTLPAARGQLNVLPGHSPLMTTLVPGIIQYKLKSGETGRLAIGWGYCQVSPAGVNVLAETATQKEEVNKQQALSQIESLENRMLNESLNDHDWDETVNENARLKAEIELLN